MFVKMSIYQVMHQHRFKCISRCGHLFKVVLHLELLALQGEDAFLESRPLLLGLAPYLLGRLLGTDLLVLQEPQLGPQVTQLLTLLLKTVTRAQDKMCT